MVEIGRTQLGKDTQLAEDSLDCYIECGDGQELMVTDAHLVSSSHNSTELHVLKLEEVEHIDTSGDKLVVSVAVLVSVRTTTSVQSCIHAPDNLPYSVCAVNFRAAQIHTSSQGTRAISVVCGDAEERAEELQAALRFGR